MTTLLSECNRLKNAEMLHMQLSWASIVAFLFVGTAFAQSVEEMLRSKAHSRSLPPTC